jgi:hypothetical protein
MKKLFAVLMTLLLVLSLPVLAMAEETTTAPETSADTTAEEVTATPEATEDPTEEVTEPESETETEAETAYKMNFGFYPETLLETLPVMGMGMLGIFLVTCVIVLAVVVLSKLGGKNKEE